MDGMGEAYLTPEVSRRIYMFVQITCAGIIQIDI